MLIGLFGLIDGAGIVVASMPGIWKVAVLSLAGTLRYMIVTSRLIMVK